MSSVKYRCNWNSIGDIRAICSIGQSTIIQHYRPLTHILFNITGPSRAGLLGTDDGIAYNQTIDTQVHEQIVWTTLGWIEPCSHSARCRRHH